MDKSWKGQKKLAKHAPSVSWTSKVIARPYCYLGADTVSTMSVLKIGCKTKPHVHTAGTTSGSVLSDHCMTSSLK